MVRGVDTVEIASKSVLNRVAGMAFGWSVNPYRGCYHRCVFCYARRTHWFLDEEGDRWGSRIFVKVNAAAVLRTELAKRSWRHEEVAIGTATDPYQPLEGRYRITRAVLQALRDYETPAHLITRSPLILRDLDILRQLACGPGVSVAVSIATMDAALAREIEPTVAPPAKRMLAVSRLAAAGVRVAVALAPVLPGINDAKDSIEAVLRGAREAGAHAVWHSTLNLQEGYTRDAFFAYLRERRPDLEPSYDALFARKYAPRTVTKEIAGRFHAAERRYPMRSSGPLQPERSKQICLLEAPRRKPSS